MIVLEGVLKKYGELTALDRVSMEIDADVLALLGANGAGKSTLLKLILGLIEPDGGRVVVCGHDVKREPVRVRSFLGYLPEDLMLYERLTGREFLRFVAAMKGLGRQAYSYIDEEIGLFDLDTKKDLLIRQYSFGMKKRIGLIAAMLGDPKILILDEPLNGLDVETILLVRRRLEEYRRQGRVVIFSSHIMDFVERTATRVVVLRRGSVVADGTVNKLRSQTGIESGHFEDVFFKLAR